MRKRFSPLADIGSELQDQFRGGYRRNSIAGPDEDPNVAHACYASPPCYMHELDPAYFGDAEDSELRELLLALLTEWMGGRQPLDTMCAAITEGTLAADLRKIRDQTAVHCRKLASVLGEAAAAPVFFTSLTLHDFTERSDIRHCLIDRAKTLQPRLTDGAARDALTGMIEDFPNSELTILVAATLLRLG